jgi:hypothetical protein
MATYGDTAITLVDYVRLLKDNTQQAKMGMIVNNLLQSNPILEDMVWTESNEITSHKTMVTTSVPTPQFRLANQGIATGKGSFNTIIDSIGSLQSISDVDTEILRRKDGDVLRMNHDMLHVTGMGNTFASNLFYANASVTPAGFTGLTPRFNSLSGDTGAQIIDAGGTGGDNASMWLVCHGMMSATGLYPQGSRMGLQKFNKPEARVADAQGRPYYVKSTHFIWDCGLAVRNPAFIVRIANIDMSDLQAQNGSAAKLIDLMIRALNRIPYLPQRVNPVKLPAFDEVTFKLGISKVAFYCNRGVYTGLDIQANNKTVNGLLAGQADGVPYLKFRGVDIQTCDALTNAESRVV